MTTRLSSVLVCVISALTFVSSAVSAADITFTGTTAGGPVWNRPVAGTPPNVLSGVGTSVPYSFQVFSVGSVGTYTFLSTAVASWDNYTFLYSNTFNPGAPLTNVVTGNDDIISPTGVPIIGSSGFSMNLNTSTDYFLVTTGFANTDFGAFSNSITGPGDISLGRTVATPDTGTTLSLLGLALLGLAAVRRKLV